MTSRKSPTRSNRREYVPAWPLVAGLLIALAPPAPADDACPDGDRLEIACGADALLGYFHNSGANFGAGSVDSVTGETTTNPEWVEGDVEPWMELRLDLEERGTLYAGASVVGEFTTDPDASGTVAGNGRGGFDRGSLYLGWCAGRYSSSYDCDAPAGASVGRQGFAIGDGFLVNDSFDLAALVRVRRESTTGTLFFLRGDADQDRTELWGASLEHELAGSEAAGSVWSGTLGLLYLHVLGSRPSNLDPRDGMDVYGARVNDLTLGTAPRLALWGEYVRESGSGSGGRFDADAWYLEGRYRLGGSWSVELAYRYARFSGDPDPTDSTAGAFDTLFYGLSDARTDGWGTWYQGEVTGEYLLFNSNQENHMLQVSATPPGSDVVLGLSYWRFNLRERNYFGTPVSTTHFADEFNVYATWNVSDNVSVYGLYGVALPGKAGVEGLGDDAPFHVFEAYLYLTF